MVGIMGIFNRLSKMSNCKIMWPQYKVIELQPINNNMQTILMKP